MNRVTTVPVPRGNSTVDVDVSFDSVTGEVWVKRHDEPESSYRHMDHVEVNVNDPDPDVRDIAIQAAHLF